MNKNSIPLSFLPYILLLFLYKLYVSLMEEYSLGILLCYFLLALMLHDLFEVSLTQCNWPQGFLGGACYWSDFSREEYYSSKRERMCKG